MSEENKKNVQELEIWNEGRKTLLVTDREGQQHEVTLRKVGLKDMHKLLEATGDDLAQAQAYLDPRQPRTRQWLEGLEDESLMDILEKGGEINDPLFDRWWARQQTRLKAMGIDPNKLFAEGMARAMDAEVAKLKAS